MTLLKDLQRERNLTYLFIAHDLSMVRVICDRMAVMYLGNIVELGPSSDVYDNPQHPYTQALIAANPLPDPVVERQRPRQMILGEIASPINVKSGCLFASRCPNRMARCTSITPTLRSVAGNDRIAACHLFDH